MLDKNFITTFKESIYFLKIEELKSVLTYFKLSTSGGKKDLIARIFNHLDIHDADDSQVTRNLPSAHPENASVETHIMPKHYTNGREYREKFELMIGSHFTFTSYGMEWIRDCWGNGIYPSYQDFADYWSKEYDRRKNGGPYKGPMTNRRVEFFKENSGMTKAELEELWASERQKHRDNISTLLKITI